MRLVGLGLLWSMATLAMAQGTQNIASKPLLEQADFRSLPNNREIQHWSRQWAERAEQARYMEIGRSAGGRPIGALFISADPAFLMLTQMQEPAAAVEHERLTLMIVGGQHGNETASPEAAQRVVYELLAGELSNLPELANFIVVPTANPDGRDLARRENSNGVNINTDYILLTQPESRALVQAMRRLQPHTVIDVHESTAYKEESLARQGYITDFAIQYEVGFEPNIDRRLRQFGIRQFLPGLLQAADARGLVASRYIKEIRDVNMPVTHGGITLRNFRNYSGFHNIFSVLVEGRVDPPGGDYPTPGNIRHRTNQLFHSIAAYMNEAIAWRDEIIRLSQMARDDWQGLAGAGRLALAAEYALNPDEPVINIRLKELETRKDVSLEFRNHGKVAVLEHIEPPAAYLVTEHQDHIAELLDRHGIQYQRVSQPSLVEGIMLNLDNIETAAPPFGKGRYEVSLQLDAQPGRIRAAAGDLWIALDQRFGRLVPLLLEPHSSTSIFREPQYVSMLEAGEFFIVRVRSENSQAGNHAAQNW